MKILISRTDAIGDLLLTLPAVKILKEHFKDSHITLLVSTRVRGLVYPNSFIDEVWEIDLNRSKIKLFAEIIKKMYRLRPSHFLFVGGSFLPMFAAYFIKVAFRGGLLSKPLSYLLLNKGIRQKRSSVEMHESNYNINLLKSFGIEINHTELQKYAPEIEIFPEAVAISLENLRSEFKKNSMDCEKPFIVIHPGMTGHTLNWSPRNYAKLIESLVETLNSKYNFLVSYTSVDQKYIVQFQEELDQMSEKIRSMVIMFDGAKNGLRDFINILSTAQLYVGPSTGTMHIANILKCKVVTIFSPVKVQSALRWGPFNRDYNSTRVVVPQTVCGEQFKCALERCPYYDCMASIEVEDVSDICVELLGRG